MRNFRSATQKHARAQEFSLERRNPKHRLALASSLVDDEDLVLITVRARSDSIYMEDLASLCVLSLDTSYQAYNSSPSQAKTAFVTTSALHSAITNHATRDLNNLQQYAPYYGSDQVTVGDGTPLPIQHTAPVAASSVAPVATPPVAPHLTQVTAPNSQLTQSSAPVPFVPSASIPSTSVSSTATSTAAAYVSVPSLPINSLAIDFASYVLFPASICHTIPLLISNTHLMLTRSKSVHLPFALLFSIFSSLVKPIVTLRLKKNSDNTITRHKTRLVAEGYLQEEGIDYQETFSHQRRYAQLLAASLVLFSQPSLYRSIVGVLQYFTITRPNISFPVNHACQFMHAPTVANFNTVKRLLRYLQCTIHLGLTFTLGSLDLHAFLDSDWTGNVFDRKSTTGYCIFLGSRAAN
ncbi:hypothetical protein CsSME_00039684 [Camellia sinensis var. sinensis]